MVDPLFPALSKFYNDINQLFRHVDFGDDFGFMSCCFQAPKQLCWGTRPPIPKLLCDSLFGCFLFSIRPSDPKSGKAFDAKRKKKEGGGDGVSELH